MSAFTELVFASKRRLAMPVAVYPGTTLCGKSVVQMVNDPAAQVEVSLALRDHLGMAFTLSAMDLSTEAEAFGAQVRIMDGEVPTVIGRLVTDAAGVDALTVPKVGMARTHVYVETARRLAAGPGDPFVVGGCIGPFTLAGRLFGVSESLEFSVAEPEAMERLITKATDFLIGYVRAFKQAGCKALFMAEPTAGLLSPKMLGRLSSPFVKRIVEAVEGEGFGIILHNCGAKLVHLPQILQSGASAFHFGAPMDLAAAARQVPATSVVLGNLDPSAVFLGGTPEVVAERTRALCQAVSGLPNVVLSSGCDVPPSTPVANLKAFIQAVS